MNDDDGYITIHADKREVIRLLTKAEAFRILRSKFEDAPVDLLLADLAYAAAQEQVSKDLAAGNECTEFTLAEHTP